MDGNIQMFTNNNQDEFLVRDAFMKNLNAIAEIIQPQCDIRKFYHTFFCSHSSSPSTTPLLFIFFCWIIQNILKNYIKYIVSNFLIQNKLCITGKSFSEAHNICRTCCVPKLFWMSKQNKNNNLCTQHVLKVFWAYNFHEQ